MTDKKKEVMMIAEGVKQSINYALIKDVKENPVNDYDLGYNFGLMTAYRIIADKMADLITDIYDEEVKF